MNRFVLDASVAVAWVSASPVDPYAITVQSRIQSGWRAVVPSLWQLEVANGLLMIERRKTLTAADVSRGLLDLDAFLASKAEVDQTLVPMQHLVDLGRTYQLTVYDAAYLELSQRESLSMATLDKNLRAAAVKAGVGLFK
ncbi:MAG TPA: type II toxin-antitoxin system VapC family toxin [Candidatus Angelobacter sp.]|nr:type II toxin-antitoxin system VapC family toxin [Candidatus Angelobacter sp.]